MLRIIQALVVAINIVKLIDAAGNSSASGITPECASNCMTIKLTEAATWFGHGDLSSYCAHPEFLTAFNTCVKDHCHGGELEEGKNSGVAACAAAKPTTGSHPSTPGATGTTATPTNSTGGPNGETAGATGATGSNSRTPPITGSNTPADLPVGTGNRTLGGTADSTAGAHATTGPGTSFNGTSATLNGTLLPSTNTTSASPSRFSSAVTSASQAAANNTAASLTPSSVLIGVSSLLIMASL